MTILLRSDTDHNIYPAQINTSERGKWGYLTIQAGPFFFQLAGEQRHMFEFFHQLAESFRVRTVAQVVKDITPEEVIAYFEASPVLQVHAADVRAVLEPMIQAGPAGSLAADVARLRPHAAVLLDDAGQPVYGYTRKAAGILFDDESANGGKNLKRIKAAVEKLSQEFTTTTQGRPGTATNEQKAA